MFFWQCQAGLPWTPSWIWRDSASGRQSCTKKQMQSFLGLVGYYRAHIPNFSTRSAPLSDLVQKKQPDKIAWTKELTETFEDVRRSSMDSPVLTTPDTSQSYHLFTDACGTGLGAVLKQKQDGELKTIGFYSYKLKDNKKNYSVIELETYAIVRACLHFAAYLRGASMTIHTDHRALKFLEEQMGHDDAALQLLGGAYTRKGQHRSRCLE